MATKKKTTKLLCNSEMRKTCCLAYRYVLDTIENAPDCCKRLDDEKRRELGRRLAGTWMSCSKEERFP